MRICEIYEKHEDGRGSNLHFYFFNIRYAEFKYVNGIFEFKYLNNSIAVYNFKTQIPYSKFHVFIFVDLNSQTRMYIYAVCFLHIQKDENQCFNLYFGLIMEFFH